MSFITALLSINLCLVVALCALLLALQGVKFLGHALSSRQTVLMLRTALILAFAAPAMALGIQYWTGINFISVEITPYTHSHWGRGFEFAQSLFAQSNLFALLFLLGAGFASFCLWRDIQGLKSVLEYSQSVRRVGDIDIRICAQNISPMTFIYPTRTRWKTILVLPTQLDRDAKASVLHHEISHMRHKDLAWNWVIAFAGLVLYMNPAFWLWRNAHQQSCEAACDTRAISRGRISTRTYLESLLNLARRASHINAPLIRLSTPFLGHHKAEKKRLIKRIHLITSPAPSAQNNFALMAATALMLTSTLLVSTTHIAPKNWSLVSLSDSTNQNLQRMKHIVRFPPYGLIYSR